MESILGENREQIAEELKEYSKTFEQAAETLKERRESEGDGLNGLFGDLTSFFQTGFQYVWSGFAGQFSDTISWLEYFFSFSWLTLNTDEIDALIGDLKKRFDMPDQYASFISDILKNYAGGSTIITWVLLIALLIPYLTAFMQVISGPAQQQLASKFAPFPASAGDIISASFIAPELHERVIDAMKRNGLSDEDIELMFISRYRLYSEGQLRDLYLRQILSKEKTEERLMEMGYTPERITEVFRSWEIIPGVSDIVRYLGHEAFEPDMINMFGLMEDFPQEATEWGKKNGLDEKWVKAEWVSHWQPPGLEMILTAFHRGKMDWNEVENYMKLVEIPPRFRQMVRDVAYQPFTRVDVRRMHDIGILDDEQLVRSYMDLGYNEEKAGAMAAFTKRYNRENDRQLTRTQIEKLYLYSEIDRRTAVELISSIGYSAADSELVIGLLDINADLEWIEEQSELIHQHFILRMIDSQTAKQRLIDIDVPLDRATYLLKKWGIERQKKIELPSKTDLGAFFQGQIIDESTYRQYMSRLGYEENTIEWYVKSLHA